MGWHLDGRAAAVWGTHTHVPTADCQVLPRGTGFVTDLGMTGPSRSVLGIKPAQPPSTYSWGGCPGGTRRRRAPASSTACLFTIDTETKKCLSVRRADIQE